MLKGKKRRMAKWLASSLAGLAVTALWPWFAKSVPAAAPQAPSNGQSGKPNVLVVVMDDVGYSDLGCYGGEIETPNIDSIARDGLRYIRFDTNAICSATRASLLTGRNSQTVKMDGLAAGGFGQRDPKDTAPTRGWMPDNVETMAQVLKSNGYNTFAIGKWHLAPQFEDGSKGNNEDFPLQRGFDYFYGYRDGWTDQYHPILFENNTRIPIPVYPYGQLLAVDLADHAISQIKQSESTSPHKPWFTYLAFTQAHAPVQVPQPYIDHYEGVYEKGWDAIRAERFARQKKMGVVPENAELSPRNTGDPSWDSLTDQQKKVYAHFMAAYAGYLQYGDEQLGRLLAYLRQTGLYQNTLVVLISDNGPASETKKGGFYRPYGDPTTVNQMEEHLNELGSETTEALYPRGWAMAGATPYRRYKLWPYLGGVRDALVVSWPGHIKDAGGVRTQYTHVVDVAPTILEVASAHFDDSVKGVQQIPVAGKSFLKTLADPNASAARTVQYFELDGNRAITSGNWRAVAMHRPGTSFSEDVWHLFNLADDPSEVHDLAQQDPAQLKEMQDLWQSQAQEMGDWPLVERSMYGGAAAAGGRGGRGGGGRGATGRGPAGRGTAGAGADSGFGDEFLPDAYNY